MFFSNKENVRIHSISLKLLFLMKTNDNNNNNIHEFDMRRDIDIRIIRRTKTYNITNTHTNSIWDDVFELFVKRSSITSFSISNKNSSNRIHMCIVVRSRAFFLNEKERTINTRIWFETMYSSYSSNKAL